MCWGVRDMSCTTSWCFLPGILGSTLSRDGGLVWGPSAGAVLRVVKTFGGSLKQLRLPDGVGDEHPGDGVEPVAVLPDLHVLPGIWTVQLGYERLLSWLESAFGLVRVTADGPPGNFLPVPYDWRLSNRYNGRRLKTLVEPALERWRGHGRAVRGCAGGVHLPFDGRAGGPMVHPARGRRGGHRQADHFGHATPGRAELAGAADQRCPQGTVAVSGRISRSSPAACPRRTNCCPSTPAWSRPAAW